jgi:hypothetical protein
MLSEIRRFAQRRATFAFETTLSGRSYLKVIRQLKKQGYEVHCNRRRNYTVDDHHSLFLNLWTSPTNLVTSFFVYNSCGLGCCRQSVI